MRRGSRHQLQGCDFGRAQHWFLLESEEPVDADELKAKLVGYRRYKSSEWRQQFPLEPTLFVCTDNEVERQVLRALSRMSADIPVFITIEPRYLHSESTSLGTMGRIWHVPRSGLGWAFPWIGA